MSSALNTTIPKILGIAAAVTLALYASGWLVSSHPELINILFYSDNVTRSEITSSTTT